MHKCRWKNTRTAVIPISLEKIHDRSPTSVSHCAARASKYTAAYLLFGLARIGSEYTSGLAHYFYRIASTAEEFVVLVVRISTRDVGGIRIVTAVWWRNATGKRVKRKRKGSLWRGAARRGAERSGARNARKNGRRNE